MAAKNDKGNTIFYTVREFMFRNSVKKGEFAEDDKTVKCEKTPEGKEYFYREFNSITGRIIGLMRWSEPLEGKKDIQYMAIRLFDGVQTESIQMYYGGSASESFLNKFLNVDLSQDVTIKISKKEKEILDPATSHLPKEQQKYKGTGLYKDEIWIYQGQDENGKDKLVKQYFTKDEKVHEVYGVRPEIEKVGTEANPSWNSAKLLEFWDNTIALKNEEIRAVNQAIKEGKTINTEPGENFGEQIEDEAAKQQAAAEENYNKSEAGKKAAAKKAEAEAKKAETKK